MPSAAYSFDDLMFFVIYAGAALCAATLCAELNRWRRDRRAEERRDALHRSLYVDVPPAVTASASPATMADILPFRQQGSGHAAVSSSGASAAVWAGVATATGDPTAMPALAQATDPPAVEQPRRKLCGLSCR